jgi:hypothetical protein
MVDRSCKRCSVTRVNSLCEAYLKAHEENNSAAFHGLREVANLAKSRGFDGAIRILKPGLANQQLRAFCWNVSSFLEDDELKYLLGWLTNRKKE